MLKTKLYTVLWQLKPREKGQVLIIVNLWRIRGTQHSNSLEAAVYYIIYSINKPVTSFRNVCSSQLPNKRRTRATTNPNVTNQNDSRSIFQVNITKTKVNSHSAYHIPIAMTLIHYFYTGKTEVSSWVLENIFKWRKLLKGLSQESTHTYADTLTHYHSNIPNEFIF